MRAIWRVLAGYRDLRLVLSAGLISMTGDWILRVGLVYRVYTLTGSTVASALTMASSFVPQVLLGALAGVFADRWDRRRTMIAANLLLAAGLLPLLLVRGAGQVWIVFAVLLFESIVQQFFSPAEQALLPRLVPDDQLISVNAVSGQAQNLARLTGSGVGGVIAAAGGIAAVAVAGAASFVISAALIALVAVSGRPEAAALGAQGLSGRLCCWWLPAVTAEAPRAPGARRRDGGYGEGQAAQREQRRVVAVPVEAEHDVVCARGNVNGDERRRHHPDRLRPAVHGCRPPGVIGGAEHRDSRLAHPYRRRGLAVTEVGAFRRDHAGQGWAAHRGQRAIPAAGPVPDPEIRAVGGEPRVQERNAAGTHVRSVRRDLPDP